jgi:hypothetical protein
MKQDRQQEQSGGSRAGESGATTSERTRRRRFWRGFLPVVLILLLLAGIGRALLPTAVRHHVNRTLEMSPLYDGRIGGINIQLWRGAYSIEDVRISRVTGNVPVPLFAARKVDFSVEWAALRNGQVVGVVFMDQPELNFVDMRGDGEAQTGAGGPWLQMIQELFPFRINSAIVENGSVHFRVQQEDAMVNVYLSQVKGRIDNLTNIRDEVTPLISTVQATGLAMDQAQFEYRMAIDPFSYRPTFQLAARFLDLDVTELNDLARAYGSFDFERGWLDLVIEAEAREGQLHGYVKPLFRHLQVSSFPDDVAEEGLINAFWQALVGTVTAVFRHRPRDQFGTRIPFSGDLSNATSIDILATVANVLRNAFVRAYLPRLEQDQDTAAFLEFSPPDFHDVLSIGNASDTL